MTPLGLGLALLLTAPALRAPPPGPEGTWEVVENAVDVFNPPTPNTWVIADGTITITYPDDRQTMTYRVDRTRSTAAIDLSPTGADAVFPGIFEVRGDTMRLAYNIEGPHRPEGFKADPDHCSVFLKRVRREK